MPNSIPPDLHQIRSSQTIFLSFHYFLKLSKWTDQGGVEPPFFVVHTVYALRLSHNACTGNASPIGQLVLLTHCEPIRFPGLPTFDWWQLVTSDSTIAKKKIGWISEFLILPLFCFGGLVFLGANDSFWLFVSHGIVQAWVMYFLLMLDVIPLPETFDGLCDQTLRHGFCPYSNGCDSEVLSSNQDSGQSDVLSTQWILSPSRWTI